MRVSKRKVKERPLEGSNAKGKNKKGKMAFKPQEFKIGGLGTNLSSPMKQSRKKFNSLNKAPNGRSAE